LANGGKRYNLGAGPSLKSKKKKKTGQLHSGEKGLCSSCVGKGDKGGEGKEPMLEILHGGEARKEKKKGVGRNGLRPPKKKKKRARQNRPGQAIMANTKKRNREKSDKAHL